MTLLTRLAEPAFAKDSLIRPSARTLGAVLVAFNVLTCISWLSELGAPFPHGVLDPITSAQIVIALLPYLLMIAGGVLMMRGDARGKRLAVLSIAVGFVYGLAFAVQSEDAFYALVLGMPMLSVLLGFFYYLVVTSQVATDPRRGRRVLSTAVMALVVGVLVLYAQIVLYGLTAGA